MRPSSEVFFHRQETEDASAFHDLSNAQLHNVCRFVVMNADAVKFHSASGDFTTFRAQNAGNRLERGALPRTVRPQESYDLPLRDFKGDPAQHENGAIIDHFDIMQLQHGDCAFL